MNILILTKEILDVLVIVVMSYVGLRIVISSSHVMRDEDLRQLKYLWMPSIVAGGFMYLLNLVNSAADFLGLTPWSVVVDSLSFISISVCLVFTFGMYRFTKFVEDFERRKKTLRRGVDEQHEVVAIDKNKPESSELIRKGRAQQEEDFEKINEILREKSRHS